MTGWKVVTGCKPVVKVGAKEPSVTGGKPVVIYAVSRKVAAEGTSVVSVKITPCLPALCRSKNNPLPCAVKNLSATLVRRLLTGTAVTCRAVSPMRRVNRTLLRLNRVSPPKSGILATAAADKACTCIVVTTDIVIVRVGTTPNIVSCSAEVTVISCAAAVIVRIGGMSTDTKKLRVTNAVRLPSTALPRSV